MAKKKAEDATTDESVEVTQETVPNPDNEIVPDATPAGHGSRDFNSTV